MSCSSLGLPSFPLLVSVVGVVFKEGRLLQKATASRSNVDRQVGSKSCCRIQFFFISLICIIQTNTIKYIPFYIKDFRFYGKNSTTYLIIIFGEIYIVDTVGNIVEVIWRCPLLYIIITRQPESLNFNTITTFIIILSIICFSCIFLVFEATFWFVSVSQVGLGGSELMDDYVVNVVLCDTFR